MHMQAKTKQSEMWITVADAKDYLFLDYPVAWIKELVVLPSDLPKTGDVSMLGAWLALLMLAGTTTLILKRKTA